MKNHNKKTITRYLSNIFRPITNLIRKKNNNNINNITTATTSNSNNNNNNNNNNINNITTATTSNSNNSNNNNKKKRTVGASIIRMFANMTRCALPFCKCGRKKPKKMCGSWLRFFSLVKIFQVLQLHFSISGMQPTNRHLYYGHTHINE
ncbi:uncharacterized protein isoform X1 [Rhodnius prolixus]|uniref:uncharacterized protein isoform X1 n=1 Tax=Rhodnius prolixus TaxID=13249 RepID=UPI003D1888E5